MDKIDFDRMSKITGIYLDYKLVFGRKPTEEEIINEIKTIEIDFALEILSKFSFWDNDEQRAKIIKVFPEVDKNISNEYSGVKTYLFDQSNLRYSIKMFLKYGRNKEDINDDKYCRKQVEQKIFICVLKINTLLNKSILSEQSNEKMLQKVWLIDRKMDLTVALNRQHEIYEKIARNFNNDNKEYIDIHKIFEDYYGYTINQYKTLVMIIYLNLENRKNNSSDKILFRFNLDRLKLNDIQKNQYKIILDELTAENTYLKKWAIESLDNFYDSEYIITKPLYFDGDSYIVFSLSLLEKAIFEGLWFKLLECCKDNNKNFMGFYGRLFEKYINNILKNSIKNTKIKDYKFIQEFKFGHDNLDSSDAYIMIGKSLLIFEAKAGKITRETKTNADDKITNKDFEKLAIKPIIQANQTFKEIIRQNPIIFKKVKKVYIFAISSQTFPRIESLFDKLNLEVNNLHEKIKYFDFIGLNDLEAICSLIENKDITIFKFIDERNKYSKYIPLENYFAIKYGVIPYTNLFKTNINDVFNISEILIRENQESVK